MDLTAYQVDALKELTNVGIRRATGVLNALPRTHIDLRVPLVEVLPLPAASRNLRELGQALSAVQLTFRGPFSGVASLVFRTESAAKLVTVLTEDDAEMSDLDAIRIGTLTEVGNIVLNSVMGVIGNELEQHIHYSIPTYVENPADVLPPAGASNTNLSTPVVWAQAQFSIEQHQIRGDIVLLFQVRSFGALLTAINQKMDIHA
jgi:chemotaxis protein CheC